MGYEKVDMYDTMSSFHVLLVRWLKHELGRFIFNCYGRLLNPIMPSARVIVEMLASEMVDVRNVIL
jgi:hypothetical protein